jgi:hypothetical protein
MNSEIEGKTTSALTKTLQSIPSMEYVKPIVLASRYSCISAAIPILLSIGKLTKFIRHEQVSLAGKPPNLLGHMEHIIDRAMSRSKRSIEPVGLEHFLEKFWPDISRENTGDLLVHLLQELYKFG